MLWEKKTKKQIESNSSKRGYLYIRETYYKRDKRTLKRKLGKGDGSASKKRGKYSKKKDIYCGKIIEIYTNKLVTFRQYHKENLNKDFLEYKFDNDFDTILDDFINYLIFLYDLTQEDIFSSKKIAYSLSSGGYLSQPTIDYIRRFTLNGDYTSKIEIERFANRCLDAGIFDEEIIMTLYLKLLPKEDSKELQKELEDLADFKMNSLSVDKFSTFIREEHKREENN